MIIKHKNSIPGRASEFASQFIILPGFVPEVTRARSVRGAPECPDSPPFAVVSAADRRIAHNASLG
jgi:hypothetical protein